MKTISRWRMASKQCFQIANSVLRTRYSHLVSPFVPDVTAFSDALRTHGAVISGSLALYYFLPEGDWLPNDMDVYVSYDEFPALTSTLENDPSLQFLEQKGPNRETVSSSQSVDIAEIKKYITPCNKTIDVIRSRHNTPISPLLRF